MYLAEIAMSGGQLDTLGWLFIMIPPLGVLFIISILAGIVMLVIGLVGASIVASRRFTFIRFAVGVLAALILALLIMLSRMLFKP